MNELALNNNKSFLARIWDFIFSVKVMVVFAALCIGAYIVSGSSIDFVINGVITRLARNGFTVLSLIIPVLAGMGLNFGIVIGAIATQIAIFWVVYWGFTGLTGILICLLIATPLAAFFGLLVGKLFNRMKGAEMIAGLILGFFADGLYQLLFLVIIGGIIPVSNPRLIIAGGVGVKNTIDLADNIKYAIDNIRLIDILTVVFAFIMLLTLYRVVQLLRHKRAFTLRDGLVATAAALAFAGSFIPKVEKYLFASRLLLYDALLIAACCSLILGVMALLNYFKANTQAKKSINKSLSLFVLAALCLALTFIPSLQVSMKVVLIPVMPFILIATICLFNNRILTTRIGQNMRTVGQSQTVANASGINVDRTRIIAMIISTVLAAWGQLVFLQNIGTFSTYGAHLQVGQFAIAALLVGGASVSKASNKQAIIGIILFHTLFIVAPQAGKKLFDNAQIGEYFRVFVSYGVIALSLAMHAWKKKEKKVKLPAAVGKAINEKT